MKLERFLLLVLWSMAATAAAQDGHPHHEATAPAARPAWTDRPLLRPAADGDRGRARVAAVGIAADRVTVFPPDVDVSPDEVALADNRAGIRPYAPGVGNYHWVQAREETPEAVRVATTVWYFSAPGPAPTEMLARARSELEIVPMPLPREHAQYREGERWRFLVRWRGQPLAGQVLALETEHGTRTRAVTDADGVATLVFPRDFPGAPGKAGAGGHRRARASFVLSTAHDEAGRNYLTAFNHVYAPEPARSRSLAWGVGFGLLGMTLAAPLLRRKETRHA